ncbi:uncharacterized protein LOC112571925 [Pomacea canaliculata]|uniref:uncharacterized protein LOC112571925 n=1 Tax=Pomacea canaliculata TaxID=400727 RepID=UPI000D731B77|nr:uncharacterized protein LOC112571925 [Pomacea canaliculata]
MKMDSVSRCYNLIWLRMLLMCVIFCVVRAQEKDPPAPYCQCEETGGCEFKPYIPTLEVDKAIWRENVAIAKEVKITSTHQNPESGPACKAVDGSTATKYTTEKGKLSCVSSGRDDKAPVWEINLNGTFLINYFKVYWDEATKDHYGDAALKVNGKQCPAFDKPVTNPSEIMCNTSGTILMLSLTGDKVGSDNFLKLCEFEAWVCFPGFYGKYCDQNCTEECGENKACSPLSGECLKPPVEEPEECPLIKEAVIISILSIPVGVIFFFICRPPDEPPPATEEKKEKEEGDE